MLERNTGCSYAASIQFFKPPKIIQLNMTFESKQIEIKVQIFRLLKKGWYWYTLTGALLMWYQKAGLMDETVQINIYCKDAEVEVWILDPSGGLNRKKHMHAAAYVRQSCLNTLFMYVSCSSSHRPSPHCPLLVSSADLFIYSSALPLPYTG